MQNAKRLRMANDLELAILERRAAASEGLATLGIGGDAMGRSLLSSDRNERFGSLSAASLNPSDQVLQSSLLERQRLINRLEAESARRKLQNLNQQQLQLQLLRSQREQELAAQLAIQERLARAESISALLRTQQQDASRHLLAASAGFTPSSNLPLDTSNTQKRSLEEYLSGAEQGGVVKEAVDGAEKHLSPFQTQQWNDHFQELLNFRKQTGHCNVPQHTHKNPKLSRWVKRQRYQYKLRTEGKPSNMTRDRMKALEDIGFVWDSHSSVWEERFCELKEFHRMYDHSNVPTTYKENPKLAAWVKCQRRQYKLLKDGKASNMTEERLIKLEGLGFEWQLRSYHNAKKGSSEE